MKQIKKAFGWMRAHSFISTVVGFWVTAFTLETIFPQLTIDYVNPAVWIVTQIVMGYTFVVLYFYVIFYGVKFRWTEYRGGQLIFALTFSLAGLVALSVLGVFVNPTSGHPWYEIPPEVLYFRPTLRLAVFLGVATTLTAMSATLIRRLMSREALVVSVPLRDDKRR